MQKNTSSRTGAFRPRVFIAFILFSIGASLAVAALTTTFVPGTAVLLNQSGSSGNGGNTTSTSSSTNIFSPAAYVDYKRFGGEPTVVVDRYPFKVGTFGCMGSKPCPPRDIAYQSAPQGFVFPRYSNFYTSDDLEQTFRVPGHPRCGTLEFHHRLHVQPRNGRRRRRSHQSSKY